MNTVHVDDVSRALWYLTTHGNNGEVYNLVDNGETSKCFKCIVEPPVCDTLGTESWCPLQGRCKLIRPGSNVALFMRRTHYIAPNLNLTKLYNS
jgi:hypothetical protein